MLCCLCWGTGFVKNVFGWLWEVLRILVGLSEEKVFCGVSSSSLEMSSSIVSMSFVSCMSPALRLSFVDTLVWSSLGMNGSGKESSVSNSLPLSPGVVVVVSDFFVGSVVSVFSLPGLSHFFCVIKDGSVDFRLETFFPGSYFCPDVTICNFLGWTVKRSAHFA